MLEASPETSGRRDTGGGSHPSTSTKYEPAASYGPGSAEETDEDVEDEDPLPDEVSEDDLPNDYRYKAPPADGKTETPLEKELREQANRKTLTAMKNELVAKKEKRHREWENNQNRFKRTPTGTIDEVIGEFTTLSGGKPALRSSLLLYGVGDGGNVDGDGVTDSLRCDAVPLWIRVSSAFHSQ